MIPRDYYLLDGINCGSITFDEECISINAAFDQNRTYEVIKAHNYIVSFYLYDRDENDLTPERSGTCTQDVPQTSDYYLYSPRQSQRSS